MIYLIIAISILYAMGAINQIKLTAPDDKLTDKFLLFVFYPMIFWMEVFENITKRDE